MGVTIPYKASLKQVPAKQLPACIRPLRPFRLLRCKTFAARTTAMAPTLQYFPVRGRGETIRLALAANNVDFAVADVDFQAMKTDLKSFPFGQAPRYYDDEVDMCQSNAILRHLGRKHNMYGKTLKDSAVIDQVLDGVEDVRGKYLSLIYEAKLGDEAKAAYVQQHISPENVTGRNGGAHLKYLESFLLASNDGTGFVVTDSLTVADIALFDIVDLHFRIFKDELTTMYPVLVSFKNRVEAVPGIKAYLESPKRVERVNGNGLG